MQVLCWIDVLISFYLYLILRLRQTISPWVWREKESSQKQACEKRVNYLCNIGYNSGFTSHLSEIQSNSNNQPPKCKIFSLSEKNLKKWNLGESEGCAYTDYWSCKMRWCFWGQDDDLGASQFSNASLQGPQDQVSPICQPPNQGLASPRTLLSVAPSSSIPCWVRMANGRCQQHPEKLWMPRTWKCSRPGWVGFWATWSSGMELDDL